MSSCGIRGSSTLPRILPAASGGQYHGFGGFRGSRDPLAYKRDKRPVALNYSYLAAIFAKARAHRGGTPKIMSPPGLILYVFNPSLITLHLELAAIREVLAKTRERKCWWWVW